MGGGGGGDEVTTLGQIGVKFICLNVTVLIQVSVQDVGGFL